MVLSDFEPIYNIGLAAAKAGIAVPTLRLYEKEGFIVPFRTSTNRRLYSSNDLRIVQTVRNLVQFQGLNFAGIRRLMSFLPCWKIKNCDSASYRTCAVPRISDKPCWSSKDAPDRKREGECRSCPVYQIAYRMGNLSIQDLMKSSLPI